MPIAEYTAPPQSARLDHPSVPLPPRLLVALAIQHATTAAFDALAEPRPGERTSLRTLRSDSHDVWLIRWGVGSRTELHDHGGSAGVLFVVTGELVEHRPVPAGRSGPLRRVLHALDDRPMDPSHVHEIANESGTVAASVHVYSPPLETMHHFELAPDSELRVIRREVIDTPPTGFE